VSALTPRHVKNRFMAEITMCPSYGCEPYSEQRIWLAVWWTGSTPRKTQGQFF